MSNIRADRHGPHRTEADRSKKRILKTATICAICGHPVDKSLKAPHPMSAAIDHIIPIAKGGHPSDISNMQLTHRQCNRQKSDKLFNDISSIPKVIGNRNLPQSINWANYRG
ncbi:TPA: HNH endonuclease [Streptococcus suis]